MSKYLTVFAVGLNAAIFLHLSWLQLEAARMTSHVHILDTHAAHVCLQFQRPWEGGKGNSVLPPSCSSYLTSHLFPNEPVLTVPHGFAWGCTSCSSGDSRHQLMCSDPQACGGTKSTGADGRGPRLLFEQDICRSLGDVISIIFHSIKHNLSKPRGQGQLLKLLSPPLFPFLLGFTWRHPCIQRINLGFSFALDPWHLLRNLTAKA